MSGQIRFVQIGVAVELHEEVHELQANVFAPLTAEEVAQIRGCWSVDTAFVDDVRATLGLTETE
ncbi:MAG: hypothetical protein IIC70_11115 [Acidobacteria bacterium]|nr:hypothetical protein [Acidobacteriota bacterium]